MSRTSSRVRKEKKFFGDDAPPAAGASEDPMDVGGSSSDGSDDEYVDERRMSAKRARSAASAFGGGGGRPTKSTAEGLKAKVVRDANTSGGGTCNSDFSGGMKNKAVLEHLRDVAINFNVTFEETSESLDKVNDALIKAGQAGRIPRQDSKQEILARVGDMGYIDGFGQGHRRSNNDLHQHGCLRACSWYMRITVGVAHSRRCAGTESFNKTVIDPSGAALMSPIQLESFVNEANPDVRRKMREHAESLHKEDAAEAKSGGVFSQGKHLDSITKLKNDLDGVEVGPISLPELGYRCALFLELYAEGTIESTELYDNGLTATVLRLDGFPVCWCYSGKRRVTFGLLKPDGSEHCASMQEDHLFREAFRRKGVSSFRIDTVLKGTKADNCHGAVNLDPDQTARIRKYVKGSGFLVVVHFGKIAIEQYGGRARINTATRADVCTVHKQNGSHVSQIRQAVLPAYQELVDVITGALGTDKSSESCFLQRATAALSTKSFAFGSLSQAVRAARSLEIYTGQPLNYNQLLSAIPAVLTFLQQPYAERHLDLKASGVLFPEGAKQQIKKTGNGVPSKLADYTILQGLEKMASADAAMERQKNNLPMTAEDKRAVKLRDGSGGTESTKDIKDKTQQDALQELKVAKESGDLKKIAAAKATLKKFDDRVAAGNQQTVQSKAIEDGRALGLDFVMVGEKKVPTETKTQADGGGKIRDTSAAVRVARANGKDPVAEGIVPSQAGLDKVDNYDKRGKAQGPGALGTVDIIVGKPGVDGAWQEVGREDGVALQIQGGTPYVLLPAKFKTHDGKKITASLGYKNKNFASAKEYTDSLRLVRAAPDMASKPGAPTSFKVDGVVVYFIWTL